MSAELKQFPDLEWPRKGQILPADVETDRFNRDFQNVERGGRSEAEVDLRAWFGGSRRIAATEEVVGLGSYGKTLTVLTTEQFAEDQDDLDYDDAVAEKWIPRFRKK